MNDDTPTWTLSYEQSDCVFTLRSEQMGDIFTFHHETLFITDDIPYRRINIKCGGEEKEYTKAEFFWQLGFTTPARGGGEGEDDE